MSDLNQDIGAVRKKLKALELNLFLQNNSKAVSDIEIIMKDLVKIEGQVINATLLIHN